MLNVQTFRIYRRMIVRRCIHSGKYEIQSRNTWIGLSRASTLNKSQYFFFHAAMLLVLYFLAFIAAQLLFFSRWYSTIIYINNAVFDKERRWKEEKCNRFVLLMNWFRFDAFFLLVSFLLQAFCVCRWYSHNPAVIIHTRNHFIELRRQWMEIPWNEYSRFLSRLSVANGSEWSKWICIAVWLHRNYTFN